MNVRDAGLKGLRNRAWSSADSLEEIREDASHSNTSGSGGGETLSIDVSASNRWPLVRSMLPLVGARIEGGGSPKVSFIISPYSQATCDVLLGVQAC